MDGNFIFLVRFCRRRWSPYLISQLISLFSQWISKLYFNIGKVSIRFTITLLFTFISLYNDSEDIRNAEVDNTADDSEAHGVEEQLRVGEDVLANVERVDLNDTLHHYHEDSVWILIIIKEPFIWFDFPNFIA